MSGPPRTRFLSLTYRRRLLDRDLTEASGALRGRVLDLGGERRGRRGAFRPPLRPDLCWLCVNLDRAVAPDVMADVAHVPFASASADAVVCTEVLEHVPDPLAVVRECARLLRPGGTLLLAVPFLVPVHPDPEDYQRFAPGGLRQLLACAGLEEITIRQEGGYWTVLAEMGQALLRRVRPRLVRWALAGACWPLLSLLAGLERYPRRADARGPSGYATGFFVTAAKPAAPGSLPGRRASIANGRRTAG